MINKIRTEINEAIKSKDSLTRDTLRLLLSALLSKEKENRNPLSESEVISVIKKEVKCLNETLEFCDETKENLRKELLSKIEILSKYLPVEMTAEDIETELNNYVSSLEPNVILNKGLIMRGFMPLVKGKADGKLINSVVENYLKKV